MTTDALAAWGAYDRDDPFPVFAEVRELGAVDEVTLADGHEAWLVVRHDEARALLNDHRLSQSKIDTTAQQIALDVRTTLVQVGMYKARIETAKTARELAQRKLEAEQDKFNLGTSTIRFVLDEQNNVLQAETNELQTVVNFTKSLVDLDRAMGMTLRKNNIELERTLSSGTNAR